MSQNRNDTSSFVKMCASMLIFGTVGIFRSYIPLSSALLSCVRGIAGALFLAVIASLRKQAFSPHLRVKEKLPFVISGCLIGLNWMFLFEAYRFTSVQIATLCYYTQPVIVLCLSPFLFGEKLTGRKIICALGAAVGMFLISGADHTANDIRGILYGLAAACLYAGVVIFNKKAPKADAYEKTIIQLSSAGMIMIPYLLFTGGFVAVSLNTVSLLLAAIVCLVHTGIAYMLYFSAMEGLKAQTIAIMGYIDPVSALLLSAWILHESLTPAAFAGAVLIIASALIAELVE